MATTTTHGLPYPELTDPPRDLLSVPDLAAALDPLIAATLLAPSGDPQYSKTLTGSALRLAGATNTQILSSTFTLTRQQHVLVGAKLRAVGSGGTNGLVALLLYVDGTLKDSQGLADVGTADPNTRVTLSIPTFSVLLSAGEHTVKIEAERDAGNIVDAHGSQTINAKTLNATTLTVIV